MVDYPPDFDKIRAFDDPDVRSALKRLINETEFIEALRFFKPELNPEVLGNLFDEISSIAGFQKKLIYPIMTDITDTTISSFTYSGVERLDPSGGYLFISNHRDIVLDSALINLALYTNSLSTAYIAIGSNLLKVPWVKDIVRLNKSFIVRRHVPRQEMYRASLSLSAYITMLRKQQNASVWIAQREGRAKDGNDLTQPGLLKMLSLTKGDDDLVAFFKKMKIVPVAISYEYDPCDALKVPSLMKERNGEVYEKKKGEDEKSMFKGITGNKGNVHINFGEVLDEELALLNEKTRMNEKISCLASLIDEKIHSLYKNHASNYMAYDLLHKASEYSHKYSPEELIRFEEYILERASETTVDLMTSKDVLLEMYARSVENQEKATA